MYMRFTWSAEKRRRNPIVHPGISFEMAEEIFDDPNHVVLENYFFEDEREQRLQIIGMTGQLVFFWWSLWNVSKAKKKSFTSFRQGRQANMKKRSTKPQHRRLKITNEVRQEYARRDKTLDNADPDAPVLPPEMWENAIIGKYYRPKKTPVTVRLDQDVLAWLKAKGAGHLTRINEILRKEMITDLRR